MESTYQELKTEQEKFNTYEKECMDLTIDAFTQMVVLQLDGKIITEGDPFDVLKRVKQINRECGLADF